MVPGACCGDGRCWLKLGGVVLLFAHGFSYVHASYIAHVLHAHILFFFTWFTCVYSRFVLSTYILLMYILCLSYAPFPQTFSIDTNLPFGCLHNSKDLER